MPTEDDERNYDEDWESASREMEDMLRADQDINYIKSQQQLD